jgi:Gp37 protein
MRLELENAITSRLAPLVQEGLNIENTPRSNRPQPKAKLIVFCENGNASSPITHNSFVQEQVLTFRLNFELTDLRSHEGIYQYIESVENLLMGFTPMGDRHGSFYLVSDQFIPGEKDHWSYTMQVSIKVFRKPTKQ